MATFEDAYDKLTNAREALRRRDYPTAITSSQECIELSIKALFEKLEVPYERRHDIAEDYLPTESKKDPYQISLRKLEGIKSKEDVDRIKICLARARVLVKLLAGIKDIVKYGILGISSRSIFSTTELQNLVGSIVKNVGYLHFDLNNAC